MCDRLGGRTIEDIDQCFNVHVFVRAAKRLEDNLGFPTTKRRNALEDKLIIVIQLVRNCVQGIA